MIQRFFQTKSFVLLIYMGMAALAYYQVFFFRHTLQWDAIDCFLAWRHAVVELIRDGQLPLWNANAYLGFPLFADPECGAWYPVLWIFSAFGNYDFYSLAAEWCLHTIIAGMGMHVLVKQLGASRSAAFIAGISFMCSGMYVSNAQNFIYLIGISWFPWVMAAVRNMFEKLSIKSALVASLTVYMMFSGSYPGITIIAFYALLVYVGYVVFYRRREWTDRLQRRRWLITVATFGFSSAILCALVLVPVAYAMPWITRTQGLGAEKILENPLSLKAMVSFVFPFAVGDKQVNWGSDFSMLNAYVGLFTLMLAGVGIFFAD
ncbi:MAG: hypothetical protein JNM00_08960, partial [Flavobacteriales bacterium]|nr:hypothetical protein [Flavobacteriales bacterium]